MASNMVAYVRFSDNMPTIAYAEHTFRPSDRDSCRDAPWLTCSSPPLDCRPIRPFAWTPKHLRSSLRYYASNVFLSELSFSRILFQEGLNSNFCGA